MSIKNKKGFTLIELVAVLVIMAIIALIVTPLVMSIIRKAKIAVDKRSVDAYGRSIELAIAGYLMDTGTFPTSISQLTIEYSGDEVVCATTQLKSDSSVYLAGCTVAGRSTGDYTYGTKEEVTYDYRVGDLVTYNGVNYRVLKDVKSTDTKATLLKAEPLSYEEVNEYGAGHVNRYTDGSVGTAYDNNGYGGMAYYTSETCGYVNGSWVYSGCTTDYAQSEVKYAVDAWASAQAPEASDARLITLEDLKSLGYSDSCIQSGYCSKSAEAPSWLHINSWYWTSSPINGSSSSVWGVASFGLGNGNDSDEDGVVRPVITISKSNLSSAGN